LLGATLTLAAANVMPADATPPPAAEAAPPTGGPVLDPDGPATRAQVAVMFHRFAQVLGLDTAAGPAPFVDLDRDRYYTEAVDWAHAVGILTGVGWRDPSVSEFIAHYFGPATGEALAVGTCESGLTTTQVGSAGELGPLQVHPGWSTSWGWPAEGLGPLVPALGYTWEQVAEPGPNAHVASVIHAHLGWGPWTCKP
jgi:hypothetical protein